jgi:DDE superfamily endonuclease
MMSTTTSNRVLYLSETFEGKEHDKTILLESDIKFNKEIEALVDLAYKGLSIKNVTIIIPEKKPKNKELTESQKESNKQKSKIRVRIEHAISGVKRLHILKHKLRMKKYEQHDLVMLLGCGLHNFRCTNRENTRAKN